MNTKVKTLAEQIEEAKLDRKEYNAPTLGRFDSMARALARSLTTTRVQRGKSAEPVLKIGRSILGSLRQFRPYLGA